MTIPKNRHLFLYYKPIKSVHPRRVGQHILLAFHANTSNCVGSHGHIEFQSIERICTMAYGVYLPGKQPVITTSMVEMANVKPNVWVAVNDKWGRVVSYFMDYHSEGIPDITPAKVIG